jgi:UDP-N-acetylglucosamine:LPS N-acetylglucosamine transferase
MAEDLEMRRALLPITKESDVPVRIFGKVDNAPDWWACADAVVLTPVEYLVSRALGYGRPLLVLQPDGPSARRLASELTRRGVAESVPSADRFSEVLTNMVAPDRWEQFVSRARTHGRSGAVHRVASALMQLARS